MARVARVATIASRTSHGSTAPSTVTTVLRLATKAFHPAVSPATNPEGSSVGAAVALMGIKLATGLASSSLGLVSEALHSGTDLVAALLTFFAIGLAVRPADRSHPYGHGKIEFFSAAFEGGLIAFAAVLIVYEVVLALLRGVDVRGDGSAVPFVVPK